jgi:hypothetical protein
MRRTRRRLNFAARRFRALLDALSGCLRSAASAERRPLRVPNIRVGRPSHHRTLRQFTEINWSGQTGGDQMLKP